MPSYVLFIGIIQKTYSNDLFKRLVLNLRLVLKFLFAIHFSNSPLFASKALNNRFNRLPHNIWGELRLSLHLINGNNHKKSSIECTANEDEPIDSKSMN